MPDISAESIVSIKKDLSASILDEGKNVTLPYLSHNYGLLFSDCAQLLKQWCDEHPGKTENSYVAQYSDKDGNFHVSLMSEKQLAEAKLQQKVVETLYSIRSLTSNSETEIVYCEHFENVQINLAPDSPNKRVHAYRAALGEKPELVKHEKMTTAKTKAINNMFSKAESSTTTKPSVQDEKKVEEKKISPVKAKTPEKKKPSPKKPSKGGSIASFFAKGASQAKPPTVKKVEEKQPEVKVEEQDVINDEDDQAGSSKTSKPNDEPKKRPALESDDESVPDTPQDNKKIGKRGRPNKKFKPAAKKSRIMQIADSSSDSEVEAPKKEIEFDEDDEEMRVPTPKKSPLKQEVKKSRKGRRTVNKTYMDPEGFVVTKREVEEYSLSEAEEEQEPEKIAKEKKKKEEKSVPAKTKQGSLLSFFSKK